MAHVPWRHSILLRTAAIVIGVACAVGALFIAQTLRVTSERTYARSTAGLSELIDTVESTVSIACFVTDQALALEVARGLLKNIQVRGVVIAAGTQELARVSRSSDAATTNDANLAPLERKIHSPFNAQEVVGMIRLEPNREEIRQLIHQETRFFGLLLVLQLIAVVGSVVFIVLRTVVHPIKTMSDGLHRLDAAAGESLPQPPGHAHTEIGRLVEDINELARRMVVAMEEERAVTRQRELEERKYRVIFDNARIGILTIDHTGHIESYNPALFYLLDLPRSSGGEDPGFTLQSLSWRQSSLPQAMILQCLDNNSPMTDDLELLLDDGTVRWINLVLSPVGENRLQGILADVTGRKQAEAAAKQEAVTDLLTGLSNRMGLERSLESQIHTHLNMPGRGFALMMLKLDGFRRINDAMGFGVGDLILKEAANRLQNCLKASDTVARLDGGKFALLLPRAFGEVRASMIGQRILKTLAHQFDVQGAPLQLGANIGITLCPGDGGDPPTLLRNAQLALDRAHNNNHHGFTFFDTTLAEIAERRGVLETDLRLALRREGFRLFYQPIVDLNHHRVVGAEALIRWDHPQNGLISPDDFIPLAEETGMICEIGLWALESACRQLLIWQSAGRGDLYLSINVSGRQIPDSLSPERIAQTVWRYGIDPSRLVLEITEGVLLNNVIQAQHWLATLRDLGFRIYLDDFGTGYSSLSYLKRFPVDTVKIDKSFIRDMAADNDDRALVEAIIAMARSLRLSVVAEGVETLQHAALLRQMHCYTAQGFLFSKPVPEEQLAAAMARIEAMPVELL
ncbi:MAG: EAL domain-containing protein [Pseudomonadota bacterium]